MREILLFPHVSATTAYLISGVLLCLIILVVTSVSASWLRFEQRGQSLLTGLLWLSLTLAFEFSFGLGVQQRSWAEMMEAYTFKDGNIWPLVLLVIFVAPAIARHIHRRC